VKFAPIYDGVAKENPKLKFLHVDVDDDKDIVEYVHTLTSSQGGKIIIRSVPAILMFYKGKHLTTLGESTESAMVEAAKDHLSFALKVKK
jgi:thiol-disulfide isomerase/thioredoxin